ncbi:MAG: toll/interleukin-1 receptor domain-containing protein [Verrucomicrobiota bacterium]
MHDPPQSNQNDCELFLSYSRKDILAAQDLHRSFTHKGGLKVWIDLEGIEPTRDWMEEIRRAILTKHIFIYLKSRHSEASEMCQFELSRAREFGMRIIVIDLCLEDSSLFDKWDVLRLPYRLEPEELTSRIALIVANESKHLIQRQELAERAFNWDAQQQPEDLLITGQPLRHAQTLFREFEEEYLHDTSPIPKFLETSVIHQETLAVTEKNKTRIRSIAYIAIFTIVVALTLVTFNYNKVSIETRDTALANKHEARELLEYMTGDLSETFQRGGNFALLSNAINRISGFFDYSNSRNFDREDHIFNSRIGHFLGDINLLRKQTEKAQVILERSLLTDDKALEKYPDDLEMIWNRSFTIFWLGEAKHHRFGIDAARNNWEEFHRIMYENRFRSSEWEYEYLNSVYNLLILAINGSDRKDIYPLEREILDYNSRLEFRSVDQESLIIDLLCQVSNFESLKSNYSAIIERSRSFQWNKAEEDFNYRIALNALNKITAEAQLYSGEYDRVEELFTELMNDYQRLEKKSPDVDFFEFDFKHAFYCTLVFYRLQGDREAFEKLFGEKTKLRFTENQNHETSPRITLDTLIGIEHLLYHNKFNTNVWIHKTESLKSFAANSDLGPYNRQRITEGAFQIIVLSDRLGWNDLAAQNLEILRDITNLQNLDIRESRQLTAYYRALKRLDIEPATQEEIHKFLIENECYDVYIDTLERWINEHP